MNTKKLIHYAILVAIIALTYIFPAPTGLSSIGWHLFGVYVATIVAILLKPFPLPVILLAGVSVSAIVIGISPSEKWINIAGISELARWNLLEHTPQQWFETLQNQVVKIALKEDAVLGGYKSGTTWLVFAAFAMSTAFVSTGLGKRIAYLLIRAFGSTTLRLGYVNACLDLIISPAMPSVTARAGGIIYPIMNSVAVSLGSDPEKSPRKAGHYLLLNTYMVVKTTGYLFLTAMAPNLLAMNLMEPILHIKLDWTQWAIAASVPGLICLFLTPLVIYFIYPPEIRETPDAAVFAHKKLAALGKIKRDEWWMLGVFALLLLFWADIPFHLTHITALKLNPTTTAFLGLGVLLISGVLSWGDVTAEKSAWDTLIWFGALVMMADWLNKLGVVTYFAGQIEGGIEALALPWFISMILLALIYLYAHYAFASTTAHISAMLVAFYGAGIALGAPPLLFGLILAAAGNLMMSLTHYATGTAPVIFSSNYATLGEWWKAGFVTSIVNFTVWVAVGLVWWKVMGYY